MDKERQGLEPPEKEKEKPQLMFNKTWTVDWDIAIWRMIRKLWKK